MVQILTKTKVSTKTALMVATGLIALGGLAYGFLTLNISGSYLQVVNVPLNKVIAGGEVKDKQFSLDASSTYQVRVVPKGTLDTSVQSIKVILQEVDSGKNPTRQFISTYDKAKGYAQFNLPTNNLGVFSYYAMVYDSATDPTHYQEIWRRTDGTGSLIINIYSNMSCGSKSIIQAVSPATVIGIGKTGKIALALKNDAGQAVTSSKNVELFDLTTGEDLGSTTISSNGYLIVNWKSGGTHTYYAVCDGVKISKDAGGVLPQLTFAAPPCAAENQSLTATNNQCCSGLVPTVAEGTNLANLVCKKAPDYPSYINSEIPAYDYPYTELMGEDHAAVSNNSSIRCSSGLMEYTPPGSGNYGLAYGTFICVKPNGTNYFGLKREFIGATPLHGDTMTTSSLTTGYIMSKLYFMGGLSDFLTLKMVPSIDAYVAPEGGAFSSALNIAHSYATYRDLSPSLNYTQMNIPINKLINLPVKDSVRGYNYLPMQYAEQCPAIDSVGGTKKYAIYFRMGGILLSKNLYVKFTRVSSCIATGGNACANSCGGNYYTVTITNY